MDPSGRAGFDACRAFAEVAIPWPLLRARAPIRCSGEGMTGFNGEDEDKVEDEVAVEYEDSVDEDAVQDEDTVEDDDTVEEVVAVKSLTVRVPTGRDPGVYENLPRDSRDCTVEGSVATSSCKSRLAYSFIGEDVLFPRTSTASEGTKEQD